MNVSGLFSGLVSPFYRDEKKEAISDLAKTECYNRLVLRFPHRDIKKDKIQVVDIQKTKFMDGSLGCSTGGGMCTQAIEEGYIITLSYEKAFYRLNTTKGTYFASDDLKSGYKYETNILNIAMQKMTEKIKTYVGFHEIIIDSFEVKSGRKLCYMECKNLDEYMAQSEETHYAFDILFEGNKYSFCFLENGENRTDQNS